MTAWRICPALPSEKHPDLPRLRDGLSHGRRIHGAMPWAPCTTRAVHWRPRLLFQTPCRWDLVALERLGGGRGSQGHQQQM